MKRIVRSASIVFLSLLFTFTPPTYPHGFSEHTVVICGDRPGYTLIRNVAYSAADGEELSVATCDVDHNMTWTSRRVTKAGVSSTDCHYVLRFNFPGSMAISCTPTQLFLRIPDKKWVQACDLKIGDLLVCHTGYKTKLMSKTFVDRPLKIFTLEIEGTHIFLVGECGIVAHNMLVPVAGFLGMSIPFDIGCGVGGALGWISLGVPALAGGLVLGGLIGLAVILSRDRLYPYKVSYDIQTLSGFRYQSILEKAENDRIAFVAAHKAAESKPIFVDEAKSEPIKNQSKYLSGAGGISPSPLKDPEEDEDDETVKTLDEILAESSKGKKTSHCKQYFKEGEFKETMKDFEDSKPIDIRPMPNGKEGKIGTLPDGRTITARLESSGRMPTLEIYDPVTQKSIKVRYIIKD